GLLPSLHQEEKVLQKKLVELMSSPITKQKLLAVSVQGIVISRAVIIALRDTDPNLRGILIGRLAQDLAANDLINEALAAKEILEAGAQVPEIRASKPAQIEIKRAVEKLKDGMKDIQFTHTIQQQM